MSQMSQGDPQQQEQGATPQLDALRQREPTDGVPAQKASGVTASRVGRLISHEQFPRAGLDGGSGAPGAVAGNRIGFSSDRS